MINSNHLDLWKRARTKIDSFTYGLITTDCYINIHSLPRWEFRKTSLHRSWTVLYHHGEPTKEHSYEPSINTIILIIFISSESVGMFCNENLLYPCSSISMASPVRVKQIPFYCLLHSSVIIQVMGVWYPSWCV